VIVLRPGVHLVDVERSGVVESVHRGSVVLVDADGSTRSIGDTTQPIFPRSANKPLQAAGMVQAGLAGPPAWLALAAASHSGESVHLETVSAMLSEAGLDESALQCPLDWPLGDAARVAARAPSRLAMNCSGKHAAMLLTCRANGWPVHDYLALDHPLQLTLARSVSAAAEPISATGIDGCGAPLFAISLHSLALAYRALATATGGPNLEIASAMRARPDLVAGTGRSATALMTGLPGLIAKDGAEGVYAAALPDGRTVAVKIDDGAQRAAEVVIVAGLRAVGADVAAFAELGEPAVLGGDVAVGALRIRAGVLA
jgi:L-asparaginase II